MAEEELRSLSIQERIASLNQAQIRPNPDGASPSLRPKPKPALPTPAPRPPSALRAKSVNNPPNEINGSVVNIKAIGNEPAVRQNGGLLPPPVHITRVGPVGSQTKHTYNVSQSPPPPPPLPARKNSGQAPPALPPRSPSLQLKRIPSAESTVSSISLSTTGTGRSIETQATSVEKAVTRLRVPAWGETELPPLPPRKEEASRSKPPRRPASIRSASTADTVRKIPPPSSVTTNGLLRPSRHDSSDSNETEDPSPRLPPRRPPAEQAKQFLSSSLDRSANGSGLKSLSRRLPPRAPSADAVNHIQDSLGGLSKHVTERELPVKLSLSNQDYAQMNQLVSGTPPPIPLASRPRIAELPAAMPAFKRPHPTPSASSMCLKCRDFSAPDTHAAGFPRQSLPSRDLPWLANQLTSPFSSPTDKARVLFTWLHHNIRYDVDSFFNNCVQPSTPQKTLDTGLAVCEGYAGLFATLATHAGLEAVVVSGHGKGFGYQELAAGSKIPPFESNHAWNAVKVDGDQWKLIDSCWGAGAVEGKGMPYIQRFDPSQFTMSNDEFGLRHFPTNKTQFYRDDGRPGISWEEYLNGIPSSPFGIEQPMIFSAAKDDNDIGERTFLPATKNISIQQSGPIRFQFSLICEHWTLTRHGHRNGPYIFLLIVHGIDGRKDDYMPFTLEPGSGPGGGGDFWYVVVEDPRTLGAPGQKVVIATVTSFGDRKDTRGLTLQEYRENVGRVGMGMSFIAQWELI
ncbi:hypothetical protein Egran_05199 [Elaphomyces granulatus]|uniref:Transglutaminase-like domain-containing protein n=1 Tax=Elaphomyces granulatus TaxID=519963 RepID=A0A232LS92_9EURO|nr:hypothetical protein Egran_05199 [Elaphomyces granulatus]